MRDVELSSQGIKINCGLGKYYDAIQTCDSCRIDLANYRPEILLFLVIEKPQWARQRISPNYEYADPQELRDKGKNILLSIDLNESDSEILNLIIFVDIRFAPPGIAALWAGRDLVNTLFDELWRN